MFITVTVVSYFGQYGCMLGAQLWLAEWAGNNDNTATKGKTPTETPIYRDRRGIAEFTFKISCIAVKLYDNFLQFGGISPIAEYAKLNRGECGPLDPSPQLTADPWQLSSWLNHCPSPPLILYVLNILPTHTVSTTSTPNMHYSRYGRHILLPGNIRSPIFLTDRVCTGVRTRARAGQHQSVLQNS